MAAKAKQAATVLKGAKIAKIAPEDTSKRVAIPPPNLITIDFSIVGTAPLVMNKFNEKALEQIKGTQMAGSQAKAKKVREPKDFQACYEGARHVSTDGWDGIPAAAFRSACIDACRLVNFVMTRAKLSIFCIADGYEKDGTALVRITKGKAQYFEAPARNDNGSVDIRARPMFMPGWEAVVRIRADLDQFDVTGISNLMQRAGEQVGIGEGRPSSKNSHGQGWGLFSVIEEG